MASLPVFYKGFICHNSFIILADLFGPDSPSWLHSNSEVRRQPLQCPEIEHAF